MAGRTAKKPKPLSLFTIQKFIRNPKPAFACALLLLDAVLVALIITYVQYTKIDWDAFMSQVTGFLEGERDYENLKGDTGPLVYQAGYLYVYSAIQFITSGEVHPAQAMDIGGVISALTGAALVQILLGLPFILSHPLSYVARAFNLGRVFIHFWSVNFKFAPEPVFVSMTFAVSLLIYHLMLLAVFAHYKWCLHEGGLFSFLHSKIESIRLRLAFTSSCALTNRRSSIVKSLDRTPIVTTMFVGNFIRIICARSLHCPFYSWYFHSLPYLLWITSFHSVLRLMLFAVVELCWNVYPSKANSSTLLLGAHLIVLWGLWAAPAEYPYAVDNTSEKKK